MRLLPTPIAEANGLRVSADPSGFVVFETPSGGARLTPEDSLSVALDLLQLHSPELMHAIERELRTPLRLVNAGGPGGAA